MTTACVIYAAKSTADEKGSIPDQVAACRRKAATEGWNVVGEFHDEAWSAWKASRGPELVQARDLAARVAAKEGSCVLLADASDRFARGDGKTAQHLVQFYFWARESDVELRSVRDDSTFSDLLLTAAMGQRAHEDSRMKAERVADGMRRRAVLRGRLPGGPRPYGYNWRGERGDKRLVSVPHEAEVVRRIYEDFVTGSSQREIERNLIDAGEPTATGRSWHQGTIARILANPLYKGCVRVSGEVSEGEHQPIVSNEVWDAAERMRHARARTRGHGGGRWPKGPHLFTKGLLRCGTCGGPMIPTTKPTRTLESLYEVYECYDRKRRGADHCAQGPVPRAGVDEAMLTEFERTHLDLEEMRERVGVRLAAAASGARELREQAEQVVGAIGLKITRISEDYLRGDLSAHRYEALTEQLESDIAGASAQLAQRRDHEAQVLAQRPLPDGEATVLRVLTELREAVVNGSLAAAPTLDSLRRALHDLFDAVVYRPSTADMPWLADTGSGAIPAGSAYLDPMLKADTVIISEDRTTMKLRRVALAAETESVGLAM